MKKKRQLVAHGDDCSIANCWMKIPRDISRYVWNSSRYFTTFIRLFQDCSRNLGYKSTAL